MHKFKCIKSETKDVPVGTVVCGILEEHSRNIILSEDSELLDYDGCCFFDKGEELPINGYIWNWVKISK